MQSVFTRSSTFSIVLFAAYLLCVPFSASAALLYLDPDVAEVYRGDTITLGLRIDTDEGECINAVDAVIKYDSSIRAVDVSRGGSILNIWVEDPVINEAEHTITFAGGIPGGYCGRIAGDPSLTNVLAELVFRSPGLSVGAGDNKSANIWIDPSSQVLINDGFGTNASVRTEGATLSLFDSAGPMGNDTWKDQVNSDVTSPADFSVALSREELTFSGDYFISFTSQDKQSGIDHYEVMEEPFKDFYTFRWGRADAPWIVAESPYVLKDQSLNSTIRVKAIDKAGNETISVLVPDAAVRSISNDRIITMIIGGIVVVILLGIVLLVIFKRRKKLLSEYEHEA